MTAEDENHKQEIHVHGNVEKFTTIGTVHGNVLIEGDYLVTIVGTPFVPIVDRVLGPAEGPRLALEIEPTRDEFISGYVQFPPSLMKMIDDMLETYGETLVLGQAASGKTILAYGYGFRHQSRDGIAFYLDCKDHVDTLDVGLIREWVITRQSPRLLLIVDNVHLIPEKFEQLRRTLRNLQAPDSDRPTSNAFSVLYLGRRVQHDADKTKTFERMEAAGRVIHLRADRHAFQAVYTRLASCHKVSPPHLPGTKLDRWVDEFGGDLIAFALAAESLSTELANPNVTISPEVALGNIRHRYLEPLSQDSVSYWNLLLLCVMAELELVAHREMFELPTPVASPFPSLLEAGIVYARTVGVEVKYDLFHPSIGNLILRGAPTKRSRAYMLAQGCFRRPGSIAHILMRMYDIGLFAEAKELESILESPDFFALCSANLKANEWHKLFRALTRSAPEMFILVEERLHKDNHLRGMVRQIAQSPLQFVSSFVRYTDKKSPGLARALKMALLQEDNQDILLANALERPLADLSLFLTYADEGMPEVGQALSRNLSKEAYKDRLLSKMLDAELHFISRFLRYADSNMPNVAPSLKNLLANEQNLSRLLEKSVQIQLHSLVEFMKYADESMPENVGRYLKKELARKEFTDRLLNQALSTELGHLKIFFEYVNRAMPEVSEVLQEELVRVESRDKLLSRALETPLHDLGGFLRYAHDKLPEIVQALDNGFASGDYKDQLLERALETDLHLVGAFLRAASESIPKTYQFVKSGLVADIHRARLLKSAADTPLGNLKSFCSEMDTVAPEVARVIKEGLGNEKHVEYLVRLRNRTLETPLDHLASFLRYADAEMPTVSQAIKDWLMKQQNRDELISRVLRTPPKNMRGFLNYAEWEMPQLVAAIGIARAQRKNYKENKEDSGQ